MGVAGMLPGDGLWDVRLSKYKNPPGMYRLEFMDSGTGVFAGPFKLRFPSPEYAVSWLSVLTELEEDDQEAIDLLNEGKNIETLGFSSNWVHVIRALFHSAGPVGGYPVSVWWTDTIGGPDPIFVPWDPLQEVPDGYVSVGRVGEIVERQYLTRPDNLGEEIPVKRASIYWDSKSGRLPVPVVELTPVEGDMFTLRLTRGPFLKEDWQGLMFVTEEGEWIIRRGPNNEVPSDYLLPETAEEKTPDSQTLTEWAEFAVDPDSGRAAHFFYVVMDHGRFLREERMWVPYHQEVPSRLEVVAVSKETAKELMNSWDDKKPLPRAMLANFEITPPRGKE